MLHLTGLHYITQYKPSSGLHGWLVMDCAIEPCCLNERTLHTSADSIIPIPGIAPAVMTLFNDNMRGWVERSSSV